MDLNPYNGYDNNRIWIYGQIFNFPNHFIFWILVFLERARDDKYFEPLYAEKSQSQVGLIIR